MMDDNILLECQKEFLFNSRYEPTEWSTDRNIPMYICNKGRVNIFCNISDDLRIEDVINTYRQMTDEMFKVCEKCKYYN